MADIEKVMSWLDGLSQPDWREYHSDSEVQNIAQVALKLLKEQHSCVKLLDERDYIVHYTGDGLQLLPDVMQELVRCKDCKFGFSEYGYVFCTKPYVEKGSANHKPDWFCAEGERRTDDA